MDRFGGDATCTSTQTNTNTNRNNTRQSRLGMVEIETGIEVVKIGYDSNRAENDGDNVCLKTSLWDIVVKAQKWPKYNSVEKERIYDIVRADGKTFTTYKKEDLHKFSLGQLLEMMNFPLRGEVLKIRNGFINRIQVNEDEYDNLSL